VIRHLGIRQSRDSGDANHGQRRAHFCGYPVAAIGIAGSGRVGTIALEECDRRACAIRPSRTAAFKRLYSSGTRVVEPDPDASFVAEAAASRLLRR
jgi:hypothetical protein